MRAGAPDFLRNFYRSALAISVLTRTICVSLTELHLHLDVPDFDDALYEFFRRSTPLLDVLEIGIKLCSYDDPSRRAVLAARIIDALALVPTIREFNVRWDRRDIGVLLKAIGRTCDPGGPYAPFVILPMLERVELVHAPVSASQYVDFIAARWRSHKRTLKAVKIKQFWTSTGISIDEDNLDYLHAELAAVKPFISEGLQFEIPYMEWEGSSRY